MKNENDLTFSFFIFQVLRKINWHSGTRILFIFSVTTEDNGTFSCHVTADSLDGFNDFQFTSYVWVDVVGKA